MQIPPLAYRIRPHTLSDYIGQTHILGKGKMLYNMLSSKQIVSMVLCGEAGVGKTTLAQIIANTTQCHFVSLSAISAGVKDIKDVINIAKDKQAQKQQGTVLFIDEIHRFNKLQQDRLLPDVESGLIVLIGATTENPFFTINNALLSRLTILHLKPLTQSEIKQIVMRAIEHDQYLSELSIQVPDPVIQDLYHYSQGDSRKALNLLESMVMISDASKGKVVLTPTILQNVVGEYGHKMDNHGDYFYDQLSAFHKSIRGSNPDAAIFWLVNMIESGIDPIVIARIMLCIASEDIGNADPKALTIALDAWQAYERLGLPEGKLPLSQAAIYLASVPKSNACYLAYKNASSDLMQHISIEVPLHLRNIQPAGEKQGGHYCYPHDYPGAYVKQQYLPDHINNQYYFPTEYGLESRIKEHLEKLK